MHGDRIKFGKAWYRHRVGFLPRSSDRAYFQMKIGVSYARTKSTVESITRNHGTDTASPSVTRKPKQTPLLAGARPCLSPNRFQFEIIQASMFNPILIYACVYTSPFIYPISLSPMTRPAAVAYPSINPRGWGSHRAGCPHKMTGRPTR
jgi:hypothetical protein